MEHFDKIVVLVVVAFMVVSLYLELFKPIVTFIISIAFLGVTRILSPQDILDGFANEQIAVIILLLVIGNIVQKTKVVDLIFGYIFDRAKNYRGFLARMMLYVSGSSAFFNNTPLVAMMMPYVHSWSKQHGISPSKLLIPLSYAAILGGSATLIGTSTNLLVNGMAVENGIHEINIFDFTWVGAPMIIIGFLYMYFWGHKLLPSRQDVISKFQEKSRKYLIEAKIEYDSKLIGKTIERASLRNLKGLYLVELIRNRRLISPVSPGTVLKPNDRLIFAGETEHIIDLVKTSKGLSLNSSEDFILQERANLIEVVVPQNSYLINKKIKETDFRNKYDAAVVAVHRGGEKLTGRIGDIEISSGDVLLLVAGESFVARTEDNTDFYFISTVDEIHNISRQKRIILMGGLILAILLSAFKVISLFKALLVLLVIIILSNISRPSEIKRSLDLNLLAIAGMALGLGKAMINTGTAEMISNGILSVIAPLGAIGALAGVFIVTNLLASYMTNIAAVSILFPISYSLGLKLVESGQIESVIPFILIVAYGASANYITPIGYLTNIMVYGSGSYSFKDFFKVGLPLAIIHMIAAVSILSFVYNIY